MFTPLLGSGVSPSSESKLKIMKSENRLPNSGADRTLREEIEKHSERYGDWTKRALESPFAIGQGTLASSFHTQKRLFLPSCEGYKDCA